MVRRFNSILIRNAVAYAHRNAVTFVASRGNSNSNQPLYPGCYPDEMVLTVTSSGDDGEFLQNNINTPDGYTPSFGNGVDFMAPGSTTLITTTDLSNTASGVVTFTGTSAACPHVAGVAALMQSKTMGTYPISSNLSPEDCEQILQNTATDGLVNPTSSNAVGYDDYAGYGRINAGLAVEQVSPPYQVLHPTNHTNTPSLYQSNAQVVLSSNYQNIAAGYYLADIWEMTTTRTWSLPVGATVIDAWVRESASTGWAVNANPLITDRPWVQLVSWNQNSATLKSYYFNFTYNLATGQQMNSWLPSNNFGIRNEMTIHVYDQNLAVGVGVQEIVDAKSPQLNNAYPNPANNSVTLSYSLPKEGNISLQLFTVEGRLLKTVSEGKQQSGTHKVEVPLRDIAQGVYFYRLATEDQNFQKKLIVLH